LWTSESYNKVVTALKVAGYMRSKTSQKLLDTGVSHHLCLDSVLTTVCQLKGQHEIMKGMLSLSGFGYNARTKSITATEEVWVAYLEVSPHYPYLAWCAQLTLG
jgi:hypothetical protein